MMQSRRYQEAQQEVSGCTARGIRMHSRRGLIAEVKSEDSLLWPRASQWRIYYHRMWVQLSTTCNEVAQWGAPSCSRAQPATEGPRCMAGGIRMNSTEGIGCKAGRARMHSRMYQDAQQEGRMHSRMYQDAQEGPGCTTGCSRMHRRGQDA